MKSKSKSDFIKENSEKGAKWIAENLNITENNVYVSASKLGVKLGKGSNKLKPKKTSTTINQPIVNYREKLDSLYKSKHDTEEYLQYIIDEIEITIKLIK